MRYFLLIALACLFSTGCTSLGGGDTSVHKLSPSYAPLKHLRPRSQMPGLGLVIKSENVITTIGESAYVGSVSEWLEERPVGSLRYRSIMRHEQEHAKRQKAKGLTAWLGKYVTNKSFAWKEEQIGWYYQLKILRAGGAQINVDGIALTLSKYKIASGNIVSFAVARAWVVDVIAGRWKPPVD